MTASGLDMIFHRGFEQLPATADLLNIRGEKTSFPADSPATQLR